MVEGDHDRLFRQEPRGLQGVKRESEEVASLRFRLLNLAGERMDLASDRVEAKDKDKQGYRR